MSDAPAEDEWLSALLPRFLELTSERLKGIEAEQRSLHLEHTCGKALVEIASIAHKIVGTAGNFGFQAFGDAAAKAEEACKYVENSQTLFIDSDQFNVLRVGINTLMEEMRLVLARR